MNIFESINDTADRASEFGEKYVDKSYQYYKLKVFQQLAYVVSMFGKVLLMGAVLFIGSLFLAIAAAIAIGEYLGDIALGYLVVGGLFVVTAIIIYLCRGLIDSKVIKMVQALFYKE